LEKIFKKRKKKMIGQDLMTGMKAINQN